MNTKHLSFMTSAAIVATLMSGCAAPTGLESESSCGSVGSGEEIRAKWSHFVNQTNDGYDAVFIAIEKQNLSDVDEFVDWADWPGDAKPEIITDLLCHAVERHHSGKASRSFLSTSKAIAIDALAAVNDEHVRQNGSSPSNGKCCLILYEELYWGTGCTGFHRTALDGSQQHTSCSE